ncbi:MAG: VWA domain-containing protein [Vicinamibacteria bacterium]
MSCRAACVAVLCLLAVRASAQSPRPPVFDSRAELVLVDVVVTDEKQQPVLDLVASDFEVSEDGVPREILSFAAFGAAATRAMAQAAAAGTAAPPQAQFVVASTVLLIDEGHLSLKETVALGPALTQILRGLTERGGWLLVLAPYSNVAFAGRLPEDAVKLAEAAGHIHGRRTPQLSTFPMTDSEAIDIELGDTLTAKRVLSRFAFLNPGMPTQMESLMTMRATELATAARARRGGTFGALRVGLDWLARQPGRHSLLLVTSGFPHDPADPLFERVATQSLRANAPIHFLDVASLSAQRPFETIEYSRALPQESRVTGFETADSAAGSERLSLDTGGLRVSGDDRAGLERILATTKTYYVLGYDPPRRKKPGFRKIKVEVRGKGLTVLARRGYFDDSPEDSGGR